MDFEEKLIGISVKMSNNKYLKAISDSFIQFMPFTTIGALATLWTSVIVNDTTGLGALWSPIMKLSVLNPAFTMLNFVTLGCISLGVAFLIGMNIGERNGMNEKFTGLVSVASFFAVLNNTTTVADADGNVLSTITGVFSNQLGSQGLFTAMIIGILATELVTWLYSKDALKIKLPEQVPPQISKSFEQIIPGFIAVLAFGLLSVLCVNTTGKYLSDVILQFIQKPLMNVGTSLPGLIVFLAVIGLLWSLGLHGDNMLNGIINPILITAVAENLELVNAGLTPTNIINQPFRRIFSCTGGTGMVLSLTLAIFLFAKRPENRSIAKVAIVPNLFNIGEINMFGLPVVLNPVLIIPFIIAPVVSTIVGYVLTVIGICPIMYIQAPWTLPPFLYGWVASGGNIMGGVCQLICVAVCVIVYAPFIKMLERQQAKAEAENQD